MISHYCKAICKLFLGAILYSAACVSFSAVPMDSEWKDGVVPYVVDDTVSGSILKRFNDAVDYYHSHTSIRFDDITGSEAGIPRSQYLLVSSIAEDRAESTGPNRCAFGEIFCFFWLYPTLNLPPFDALDDRDRNNSDPNPENHGYPSKGRVIHELMHTIGFFHEQRRVDRNNHMMIYDFAFDQQGISGLSERSLQHGLKPTAIGPYDIDSIMLYAQNEISHIGVRKNIEGPVGFYRIRYREDEYGDTIRARSVLHTQECGSVYVGINSADPAPISCMSVHSEETDYQEWETAIWEFEPIWGDGVDTHFYIKNFNSGEYLAVTGGNIEVVAATMRHATGVETVWRLETNSNGEFSLVTGSGVTEKTIRAPLNSGVPVVGPAQVEAYNADTAQSWIIEELPRYPNRAHPQRLSAMDRLAIEIKYERPVYIRYDDGNSIPPEAKPTVNIISSGEGAVDVYPVSTNSGDGASWRFVALDEKGQDFLIFNYELNEYLYVAEDQAGNDTVSSTFMSDDPQAVMNMNWEEGKWNIDLAEGCVEICPGPRLVNKLTGKFLSVDSGKLSLSDGDGAAWIFQPVPIIRPVVNADPPENLLTTVKGIFNLVEFDHTDNYHSIVGMFGNEIGSNLSNFLVGGSLLETSGEEFQVFLGFQQAISGALNLYVDILEDEVNNGSGCNSSPSLGGLTSPTSSQGLQFHFTKSAPCSDDYIVNLSTIAGTVITPQNCVFSGSGQNPCAVTINMDVTIFLSAAAISSAELGNEESIGLAVEDVSIVINKLEASSSFASLELKATPQAGIPPGTLLTLNGERRNEGLILNSIPSAELNRLKKEGNVALPNVFEDKLGVIINNLNLSGQIDYSKICASGGSCNPNIISVPVSLSLDELDLEMISKTNIPFGFRNATKTDTTHLYSMENAQANIGVVFQKDLELIRFDLMTDTINTFGEQFKYITQTDFNCAGAFTGCDEISEKRISMSDPFEESESRFLDINANVSIDGSLNGYSSFGWEALFNRVSNVETWFDGTISQKSGVVYNYWSTMDDKGSIIYLDIVKEGDFQERGKVYSSNLGVRNGFVGSGQVIEGFNKFGVRYPNGDFYDLSIK